MAAKQRQAEQNGFRSNVQAYDEGGS